jgi:hypothetical protein
MIFKFYWYTNIAILIKIVLSYTSFSWTVYETSFYFLPLFRPQSEKIKL